MFKPRLNQVFRSRWHALWWAAGICLTAYCSVPQTRTPDPAQAGQQAAKHDHGGAKWWMKDSGKTSG